MVRMGHNEVCRLAHACVGWITIRTGRLSTRSLDSGHGFSRGPLLGIPPNGKARWASRGQHLAEYALVIAVATIGLGAMSTYVRRAIQAKVKTFTDQVLVIDDSDLNVGLRPLNGDFNGDGQITADEIARVENFANGIPGCSTHICVQYDQFGNCTIGQDFIRDFCPSTLSNNEQRLADVNGNGQVDVNDAWLLFALQRGIYARQDLYGGAGVVTFEELNHIMEFVFFRHNVFASPEEQTRADLDQNGRIDIVDYLYADRIYDLQPGVVLPWPTEMWWRFTMGQGELARLQGK